MSFCCWPALEGLPEIKYYSFLSFSLCVLPELTSFVSSSQHLPWFSQPWLITLFPPSRNPQARESPTQWIRSTQNPYSSGCPQAWVTTCHVFSCPTLYNLMDRGLPGSSVHGISQARILEWVTMASSRGSSWIGDRTLVSCVSCIGRQSLHHCKDAILERSCELQVIQEYTVPNTKQAHNIWWFPEYPGT